MNRITIGIVGSGRGTELHMMAYSKVVGCELRFKTIVSRRKEKAIEAMQKYGFENASTNYNDLLLDPEIDVIDICTPPYKHFEMIKEGLIAGKHVICEKPLSGCFDTTVSKETMYKNVLDEIEELREVVNSSKGIFMYAENFIYAPAIQKAAELNRLKKSKMLYIKGEESLKGSSSRVAGDWKSTGGGTLIRTGSHPLSAAIWLKKKEADARNENVHIVSAVGDTGQTTTSLNKEEHKHIDANPNDVEDFGTVTITFSDGTKSTVIATDSLIGGSKNYIEIYSNDSAIKCNLTMNNLLEAYFADENGLTDITLSEMQTNKIGWNNVFVSDEYIRGYVNEMQDFMDCVSTGKRPESDFGIASETLKVIYAAYYSADSGKRIDF